MIRDAQFYDFIAQGLASLGYVEGGRASLQMYLDDMFAEKWNAEKTYAQMGFPLDPDIRLNPTYEQIEAVIRPYTMAAYVDYDSDGPSKSVDGATIATGEINIFKHEVYLDRKKIREKIALVDMLGGMRSDIVDAVMNLFFTSVDSLIGGNFNTVQFQRHQIVGNEGKLVIDGTNNPYGLPFEIDFEVPAKNKNTSTWYYKDAGGNVVQVSGIGKGVNPITVAQKIVENAEENDAMPAGHWECSKQTKRDLLAMPFFRELFAVATRPDINKDALRLSWSYTQDDEVIWNYIQQRIGRIEVIDKRGAVEFIDPRTRKAAYHNLQAFREGVLVYVPDGDIGTVQSGKLVAIDDGSTRTAYFDDGRTMIREVRNGEKMTIKVKSESQTVCVPNATRWFYYLNVMGDAPTEPTYTYTKVTPEAGDNPSEKGWYVQSDGGFILSTDTEVQEGTDYYTRSEA
ncbi:MAG: hypothetical protein IJV38_08085 [Prevotella sp.]|nr:hypothetical protein [Prevotella sp.]